MKKITLLILLTAFSFTGFSQNLVLNSTFVDATDWSEVQTGAGGGIESPADSKTADGSSSYRVVSNAGFNSRIQYVNIPASSLTAGDYTFSYWVKGTAGDITRPIVRDNGINVNGANYAIVATGVWEQVTEVFNVTAAGNLSVRINNRIAVDGSFFLVDDVSFTYIVPTGNVLTVNTVGAGTVTKTPDQPSYLVTDVVTLEALPATHWNFASWSGDLTGSINPESLLMDVDKTVTATFTIDPLFTYDFLFDTDNQQEGWAVEPGITIGSHTGGVITLVPEVNNFARFSLVGFPVPSTEKFMQITMQNLSTADDVLRVIIGNQNIEIPITTSNATMVSYEFDLSALTTWTGDVSSIRLRFADLSNASVGRSSGTGNILVDQIVFNSIALSVNDIDYREDTSLTLYPNPVNDVLNINSPLAIEKVEVFNLLGQRAMIATTSRINTSNLAKGMYLVKVTQEGDVVSTKRFIKQ
ncbi:MAG: hypothetical protein COB73_07560 [Flavobacteriaceae bacterium]|nr:MAG: hypothetical protein COB73_07560 [Flavobacteriaceae bacterium]